MTSKELNKNALTETNVNHHRVLVLNLQQGVICQKLTSILDLHA